MKKWLYSKTLGIVSLAVMPSSFIAISCNKEDKEMQEFNKAYDTNLVRDNIKNIKNIKLESLISLAKSINLNDEKSKKYFGAWVKPAVLSIVSSDEDQYSKQVIDSYVLYLEFMINRFINSPLEAKYNVGSANISKSNWNIAKIENESDVLKYKEQNHDQIDLLLNTKDPEIWKTYWNTIDDGFKNNLHLNMLSKSKIITNNKEITMWENLLQSEKRQPLDYSLIDRVFDKFIKWFPTIKNKSWSEKYLIINELETGAFDTFNNSKIVWSNIATKKVTIDNKPNINIKAEVFLKYSEVESAFLEPIIKIVNNNETKESSINIVLTNKQHSQNSYVNHSNINDFINKWYDPNKKLTETKFTYGSKVTPLPTFGEPIIPGDTDILELLDLFKPKAYKLTIDINIPEPEFPVTVTTVSFARPLKLNQNDILIDESKLVQLNQIASKLRRISSVSDIQINDSIFKISDFTDDELSRIKDIYSKIDTNK
ncbi:hypothetical protein ACNQ1N_01515 [Mycoplasma sp. HF11B]|uniref:hypothetical protein n=1 Tax=Mycoplasma sp. HF11B TaxID=3401681 RepID=UPI003AAEA72E